MAKQDCTTCHWAEFEKTKSGRRNLDCGECKIEVILPNSFRSRYRDGPLPTGESISKYTKPDCPLWKKDTR